VGGGFGGKAGIQLEPLACLLAMRFPGRPVRLVNTREADLVSSPGRPGLQSRVRIGASRDGAILAMDMELLFDSGAYADYAVNVSRAAAVACTGPYNVPNVTADTLCVYTNHPFATAFRGFGHIELSYATERAMDLLAVKARHGPPEAAPEERRGAGPYHAHGSPAGSQHRRPARLHSQGARAPGLGRRQARGLA
jgi:CO/xanthine dehydrogenase Mo-binding subunit